MFLLLRSFKCDVILVTRVEYFNSLKTDVHLNCIQTFFLFTSKGVNSLSIIKTNRVV